MADEYSGRERLQEHVVRILDHLPDLNRARYSNVGEFIEDASRLVKDMYKVKYLEAPTPQVILTDPGPRWSHPVNPISISTHVQNVEIDAIYIGKCGEGFSTITWHLVQLCLRELAMRLEHLNPRKIRFWGRILGKDCDAFYIFEVLIKDAFHYRATCGDSCFYEIPSPTWESLLEFQQSPMFARGALPDVSTLSTLSCIIAHVSGETIICLQDQYTDEFTVNPDFELSSVRGTSDISKWVHARRMPATSCHEAASPRELFTPLTESEWAVSDCGGVTLIRNLKWRGSFAVCYKGRVVHMYDGWGVPATEHPLFKTNFPDIQQQRDEAVEFQMTPC